MTRPQYYKKKEYRLAYLYVRTDKPGKPREYCGHVMATTTIIEWSEPIRQYAYFSLGIFIFFFLTKFVYELYRK